MNRSPLRRFRTPGTLVLGPERSDRKRPRRMRFSDAFLRQLRERASIADFAGKKLVWDRRKSQPAKGDYWACCPFHGEKSASFHVRDDRGSYKCFGCGESGSVIDLAMKLEGLSFPEAVARLAEFAGLPLPEADREDAAESQRRRRLFDAAAACAALYRKALGSPDGRAARAYLESRGFGDDLWERFGVGYAPGGWTWAADKLTAQGFTLDELVEAGVATRGADGRRTFDVFRERITFEIADSGGKTIAFGGRAMNPEDKAKYLNSPESALFHKGRTLYRLKAAREIAAKAKATGLVVAEGYFDVIALERAGIAAVAPLGTALTEDQLQLVWRSGGEPVLCFDGDAAGVRAAHRALDLALPHLAPGRTVKIAHAPGGADPDDIFRQSGAEGLKALIDAAQPAADALFARERDARPLDSPEAKADFKKRLRAAIGRIGDPETRAFYLRDALAKADALLAARPRSGASGRGRATGRFAPPPGPMAETRSVARPRPHLEVERIVRMACDRSSLLARGADALTQLEVEDPVLDRIRTALLDAWFAQETVDRAALKRHLQRLGDTRAQDRIASWPPAKDFDASVEQEWMALVTLDLAAPKLRDEAREMYAAAETSADAMALAQSMLASRRETLRGALRAADPTDDAI
ncbi:MAG: DNA primase [Alphaproteobacteria bacterium]|nr:DNA primase [Alphaproteobacteria bacterium]